MYETIASFYDKNIGDVNYDLLADFLHKVFIRYRKTVNGDEKPIVLDAACGTGVCTAKLAEKGYDMIGLDLSPAMLQIAAEREGADRVMWICQDMTEMDLFGTVQAVFCNTDSINHLLEPEKLERFFKRAALFTERGGLLVFDCLTDCYYREIIDGNIFCQEDDRSCYIWSGQYDGVLCDYDITCFKRAQDDRYIRLKDSVTERMWTAWELSKALAASGYQVVGKFSGLNFEGLSKIDGRRYYVCRKK